MTDNIPIEQFPDKQSSGKGFSFADVEVLEPVPNRVAHIDADMLVYAACHTVARNDNQSLEEAIIIFNGKVGEIKYNSRSESYLLMLSGGGNYRHDYAVTKEYKGNRADREKPPFFHELRAHISKNERCILSDNEEADDLLGKMQHENSILCTDDKDLNMIPGLHYRLRTKEIYETSDYDVLQFDEKKRKISGGGFMWFLAQLLTGDSTDNINGLESVHPELKKRYGIRSTRGCGDVSAYKILGGIDDIRTGAERVAEAYAMTYGEDAVAKLGEMCVLLWIRRSGGEIFTNSTVFRYMESYILTLLGDYDAED